MKDQTQGDASVREALGRAGLFMGLPRAMLDEVAGLAVVRDYPAGQELFHSGEAAAGFYVVVSGRVKVYKASASGKELILHVFGPGAIFGEVPVFQGGTFPACAQALDPTRAAYVSRSNFKRAVKRDPELAMSMLALLAGRLRGFVDKLEALSLKEVPARLASHLLLLREAQGADEFRLDLTKGQVAAYLGTIQETLSRVFRRLAEQGLIEVDGPVVRILDAEGLEEVSRGG
ncbi:MAG: Crp/Fnr family transcriptional regulator [Desulfovibrionaceae bacterium]